MRTQVLTTGCGAAVAISGGTAPYITTWLSTSGHGDKAWLYVAAAALVGVPSTPTSPRRRGRS
ncbi:hypothetical protein E1286_15275 [Nonomuraea terrae]|uniref:Uncharacterized protein n=1 Tax=Nonomuraea terrae TaxID=2530383 RepID=A0A4R4YTC2_9ACTN|nr:hypothetical protein [Nonomuraea terrae]TDD48506.1 hypothetical protein E1286_15275 [Nonomuraea terrae]